MEFGPEIKVDGKRPEWLKDDDQFRVVSTQGEWARTYTTYGIAEFSWRDFIVAIRLPADHSHYQQSTPTPDERAVAPELVYRMKNAILRHVACKPYLFDDDEGPNISVEAELRSIAAALEPVVDEDLVIAREIACERLMALGASSEMIAAGDIAKGERDDAIVVHVALAALRRGRALASRDVTPCTREQFEDACRV